MYNAVMRKVQLYIDETLAGDIRQVATIQRRPAAAVIRDAVRAYVATVKVDRDDDPFLPIVGAYTGGPTDAAQEHDRYLYSGDAAISSRG
jgi:hypothetical protein